MENPLVSIIMAVKDTAEYLPACIESIMSQTYPRWELIAVNDHSTDETPNILAAYAQKDERIKVFHSKQPRLIPTLQEGYRHASGTLINRMDSDDKMPHDKLEVLVNEWQKYGKGTIIAGGTKHFVDEGEVGGGFIRYENWLNDVAKQGLHYQEIYKECVIPSHCWIIHRDDFEAADGFNPVVYPEDYDLCFRFYRNRLNVVGIDKILHFWRDRSNRISRTWDEYKDNRYFDLKLSYFFELDRDPSRPLVIWGAGRNGKDLIKQIQKQEANSNLYWVCESPAKIGKDIYGLKMMGIETISSLKSPQILIAVASPDDQRDIRLHLEEMGKEPVKDYWFFI